MEAQGVIHHQLDLALRLVDSITGRAIEERNIQFLTQSQDKTIISRGAGSYLFLNTGRADFDIEIRVYGYEPRKIRITYPIQKEHLPIRDVYLLPLNNPVLENVLSLWGNIPGIEEIEAVSLTNTNCCIKEFDARTKIMTILNQKNAHFRHSHYGLLNKERTAFEHFELEKEINLQTLKCKKRLQREFQINQPIVRVIFGQTNEQGDYVLKVENDENAQYLVRYVVNGKEFFQKVDFHEEGNVLNGQEEAAEVREA